MKVLYDHQIFSHQRYGGISRYFTELWMRLGQHPDVDLRIIAGLITNAFLKESLEYLRKEVVGIRLPDFLPPNRFFSMANRHFFEHVNKRYLADLYHPTYYRWLDPSFGGRRVVTVYDMIHERLPQYMASWDPTTARKKFAVEHADGIICLSNCTSRDLQTEFRVPAQKIRVIYPAASLNTNRVSEPPLAVPYLLYVGTRTGYKNFHILLKSLQEAPDITKRFRLASFGGGRPSGDEIQAVRNAHLEDRVVFVGGSDEVLASLYRHAALLVFPSLYEGFGLPVLEAMQAGCPVVVSNRSSLPEVAGDAGLYFDPESSEDLSHQIRRILGDDGLRRRLVSLGLARAATFSWEKTAAETVDFYKEVLAE